MFGMNEELFAYNDNLTINNGNEDSWTENQNPLAVRMRSIVRRVC